MVFSSYTFLLAFLPLTLSGYFLLSRVDDDIYQKGFLIAASLVFYGYYHVNYLFLILLSIAMNYAIALGIQRLRGRERSHPERILLLAGVAFNVLLIGYYKYYDFFAENVNHLFGTDLLIRNIALPLGISFFTFQQLSFLISIYSGEEKVESLRDYCLFVTYFPQLVAGPIVLYSEMIPQFKDRSRRTFNWDSFASGVFVFSIGLFKKAVIADTFALFVNNGFGLEEIGFISAWAVALSYTLQIYFDFSGYSDMAVGLARMFNIDLPFNFLSPYLSESITEFWRRWHITLGRALRSYVYKPLGGNRRGMARTCMNLLITFLISGLWHGAAWTFVLWGGLNGLIMVFERIASRGIRRIPKGIRIALTFLTVNFLWVLFRAESFEQARILYQGMFGFSGIGLDCLAELAFNGVINYPAVIDYGYVIGLIAVCLMIVFGSRNSRELLTSFKPTPRNMAFAAMLLCGAMICLTRQSIFIYFNF